MASTYANMPTQQASKNAAISGLTTASLQFQGTVVSADGRIRETRYEFAGTSSLLKTIVTVRHELTKSGTARCKVQITNDVSFTDPVTAEVSLRTYEVGLFWNADQDRVEDGDKHSVLIQTVCALLLGAFDGSTGVPSAAPVKSLNIGKTALW